MNCASCSRTNKRFFPWLLGLAAFLLVFTGMPRNSSAQTVVVANVTGKAKRLRGRVRNALVKALSDKGVKLVSYKQYLQKARRNRIKPRRALQSRSIRKVSKVMKLDGVVTGAATRKGRRFIVLVNVFNSNGKRVLKKAYRLKKQVFPAGVAEELAGMIVEKLGGESAPPEPPPEPPPPEVEDPAVSVGTDTSDTGSSGKGDSFLPPWARTDSKGDAGATGGSTETAAVTETETETEVSKPAPKRKRKKGEFGSVPDVLLAAGMSGNIRAGLHPRHESGIYPGVRVDARMFFGTFLDVPVVKDIGIGGMFNMGLALKYGLEGGGDDWDSSMMQWQGELNYRFAINSVTLKPAFLLRVGYGSTVNTIDTTNVAAVSAGYSYPYAAIDIYLMLWDPMIRMFVSGGFLFHVAGSEDVSDSGMGFTVRGGVDVDLFSHLHIGVGYELFQFFGLQVSGTEVSDTFHSFFGRVGWNFH